VGEVDLHVLALEIKRGQEGRTVTSGGATALPDLHREGKDERIFTEKGRTNLDPSE
jgi:hypothetical protein